MTDNYAPEFQLTLHGLPAPAELRAAVTAVRLETGLEGADRLEISIADGALRWLDDDTLRVDTPITLSLGYAPGQLRQAFAGEIVALAPSFPGGGIPTFTVIAQDALHRLQSGAKVRWFAVPVVRYGQFPMSDLTIGSIVAAEHGLLPAFEPIGAALSVLLGGVDLIAARGDPAAAQKVIRRQAGESDYDFLGRIAAQNGWEMTIDHAAAPSGSRLRFFSALDHLTPDLTLRWGRSLLDFTPRLSSVGQILSVQARIWRPEIRAEFTVTVAWDWDRMSLSVQIIPGFGAPGASGTVPNPGLARLGRTLPERAALRENRLAERRDLRLQAPSTEKSVTLLDQPLTLASAPRMIVGKLVPLLNRRLTGTGSTVGDPRIQAGAVLRIEGVGARFGGLYRVTSATHTVDQGGYRTTFQVRKEIWFGSIPLPAQGAVPVRWNL